MFLGLGFGYGESEYEVSFRLAPQNGELSPTVPKTQEFNSPFRARNPERSSDSNSPQNLGSVCQNLGSRSIKGRWLLFCVFDFRGGEIKFFLDLSVVCAEFMSWVLVFIL